MHYFFLYKYLNTCFYKFINILYSPSLTFSLSLFTFTYTFPLDSPILKSWNIHDILNLKMSILVFFPSCFLLLPFVSLFISGLFIALLSMVIHATSSFHFKYLKKQKQEKLGLQRDNKNLFSFSFFWALHM